MKTKYIEIEIIVNGEERKAAFTKEINRDITLNNVMNIVDVMKVRGYIKAEMIQVIKAEEAIRNEDIKLIDINEQEIKKEDAKNYYLIIDGQNRAKAASLYNKWASSEENTEKKEIIQVPATIIELQKDEKISEYINDINITKKPWEIPDYLRSAANTNPENKFLKRYNELIKRENNPNGYPLSTLNLIFCGQNNAISKFDFSLLCSGEKEKGKRIKKNIIPANNIELGNKFIEICKNKGFDATAISKRYLITQFIDIRTITSDVNIAIKAFESITEDEKSAMFNKKNLKEDLVIKQFKEIKKRLGIDTQDDE